VKDMDNNNDKITIYLKQWSELSEGLKDLSMPILEEREKLQKAIQPIIDTQQRIYQQVAPVLEDLAYNITKLQSIQFQQSIIPNLSELGKSIINYQKSIQEQIGHVFEGLQRTFRDLSPRVQEALILLGEHGWYFDMDMPIPNLWELKEMLTEGEVTQVEELLCAYYEAKIDEIEESIVEKYPNRQKPIKAAFSAHRRQEYLLSIPVLLAQADGICKEVINENYFRRTRPGLPRTAYYVEKIASDTFTAALLSPLAQNFPIMANENERSESFSELNRHMVLHGESLDYGTKINSLKAISLINYIAHVLPK
jgi:hypothetical protein